MDIRKKGVASITIDKLLGYQFQEERITRKSYDVSEYEAIVFDEIYLVDIGKLEMIRRFMNRNNKIKYFATGDSEQLKPIDNLIVVDKKAYYNNIIYRLFPNSVNLQQNKRCNTEDDRKIMSALSTDIRNSPKHKIVDVLRKYGIKFINKKGDVCTMKNVCATNKECDWVNRHIMKKVHPHMKYTVGMEVIGRCTRVCGKGRLFVNYTYTIESIDMDTYVLSDGDEKFVVNGANMDKWFRLPYARTCNSYQGMTEEQKITIFGIGSWFVDSEWVYTAITRTTSIENLHVYVGESNNQELVGILAGRITSHKTSDVLAGRELIGDFVDIKWGLDMLQKTKTCRYCRVDLDESNFSIDRLDNNMCHSKANCQIICTHCNISKK
jgi:hypothetical protein